MPTSDIKSLSGIFSATRLILATTGILVTWLVIRAVAFVLSRLAARSATRRLMLLRLIPVLRMVFWFVGSYLIIVLVFRPSTQSVLAVTASAAIAVGFAAQDILRNVFGGIVVILDQPFQVGDKIEVGDYFGEVVSIGLRSVKLVTNDDSLVTVPNSQIVNQAVSNGNAGQLYFQVVPELLLPPTADLELATSLAWEAAVTSPYVYLEKPVTVRVMDEFNERLLTKVRIKAYVLDTRL